MLELCKKKPNRTKKRYFSTCDSARIAEQVYLDRGVDKSKIVATIGKRLGFSRLVDATQLTDARLRQEVSTAIEIIKTIEDLALLIPIGRIQLRIILFLIRRASEPIINLVVGLSSLILAKFGLPEGDDC